MNTSYMELKNLTLKYQTIINLETYKSKDCEDLCKDESLKEELSILF